MATLPAIPPAKADFHQAEEEEVAVLKEGEEEDGGDLTSTMGVG